MFSGIVETLGRVQSVIPEGEGTRFVIQWPGLNEPIAIGESIAVNGCCLTVVERADDRFTVQAGPETLERTNLGRRRVGDPVNLERSLRLTDRLGGHFVQGHVDGVAAITAKRIEGDWVFLRFDLADPGLTVLMVPKGSVAVDGVSLTIVEVDGAGFSVMLIPHTLSITTLGTYAIGEQVNIEADMLAKHVRKLMGRE